MPSWNDFSHLFIKSKAPEISGIPEEIEEESPEVSPIVDASGSPAVIEGRPFEDIYVANGVPVSPYSAEKLLAFIAGLATMPLPQIQMVVGAMDAADTSWTLADPVHDAEAKIAVLQSEKSKITATVQQVEAQGKTEAEALDTGLATASTDIRQQIEALQAKLQEEIARVTSAKTDIDNRIRSAKESGTRENLRFDAEIGRLNTIPNKFPIAGGK